MNRQTAIGLLGRYDEARAVAELKRAIMRRRGDLKSAARSLCISRRQIFRLVHRYGIWHFVWSVRRVARRGLLNTAHGRVTEPD